MGIAELVGLTTEAEGCVLETGVEDVVLDGIEMLVGTAVIDVAATAVLDNAVGDRFWSASIMQVSFL